MSSTHAKWLADCADRCVTALRVHGRQADYTLYAEVAHQIGQAYPDELREFVESYPLEKALVIAPLMVLAWRIVGNEFRSELARRASDSISMLCDIDEWEAATDPFGPFPPPAGGFPGPPP